MLYRAATWWLKRSGSLVWCDASVTSKHVPGNRFEPTSELLGCEVKFGSSHAPAFSVDQRPSRSADPWALTEQTEGEATDFFRFSRKAHLLGGQGTPHRGSFFTRLGTRKSDMANLTLDDACRKASHSRPVSAHMTK